MKLKCLCSMFVVVFLIGNLCSAKAEDANRLAVAKTVMEHMCIYLQPEPKDAKEDDLFDVISKVLATRGVTNFQETNLNDKFTIGEMEDIFNKVNAIAVEENKVETGIEVKSIFAQDKATLLSLENLQKIVQYFPTCEPTVEAYTPPETTTFLPSGPDVDGEEPASAI